MKLNTELLEYQEQAVKKLNKIKVGALFMEQGTGKTITALELIRLRLEAGKINRVIWLCPCSVKKSLSREIVKHSPDELLQNIVICGIETLSSSIRANSLLLEMVKIYNCYLVVDESLLVKNHMAIRTRNITRLSERCTYKLILNGTPISRNAADLFSQFYILDWRILGYKSYWSFSENHINFDDKIPDRIVSCRNVDYLTNKIAPYTYEVKKSDCLKLPDKKYHISYFDLTDEQEEHYADVAERLFMGLDEYKPHTLYRLFSGLQAVTSGFYVTFIKDSENTKIQPFFNNPEDNPRIQQMLKNINGDGTKQIIFCKYKKEIDDVIFILNKKYGFDCAVRFDGEASNKVRQENLRRFEKDAMFLVANKACGCFGLNLQFCNNVVYYNNDWDYATKQQSEDRVHRIGQTKDVINTDICASCTLDERILECLYKKELLLNHFKKDLKSKNKDEIMEWLGVEHYRRKNKPVDISDLAG